MAAIIAELRTLSSGKNGLSPNFFVEFLRTRVSESTAIEVQGEIDSILNQVNNGQGRSVATDDATPNDIVLLRAGISFSEGAKSVRIKPSTAEALVARKLRVVTGATMEEDRQQLVDDIAHLEEILVSSTTEGVEVETILQASLGGHVGEGVDHENEQGDSHLEEGEAIANEFQVINSSLEDDTALHVITNRIAQLEMVHEKSKESNEGDRISAIHYVTAQLQELEAKVEKASENAFSRYDSGEAPIVANIKDLLVARKRLKEAKAVFDVKALKFSDKAKDGLGGDELEAAYGKLIPIEKSEEKSTLNTLHLLKVISTRIPQISQTLLERSIVKVLRGDFSKATVATFKELSQDVSEICRHLDSFSVARNGALAFDGAQSVSSLHQACARASLESIVTKVTKGASARDKEGGHIPWGISAALADARSYIKHYEYSLLGNISSPGGKSVDDMTKATQWLRERSLLLYLTLFRPDHRRDAIISFSEVDPSAVFFAALATVNESELGISYDDAVDWFASNVM